MVRLRQLQITIISPDYEMLDDIARLIIGRARVYVDTHVDVTITKEEEVKDNANNP